jgi:hypothetical protein
MVSPFGVKGSHELLEYVHCRGVLQGELALELHNCLSSDINLSRIEGKKDEVRENSLDLKS